jgi:hypothetical protein
MLRIANFGVRGSVAALRTAGDTPRRHSGNDLEASDPHQRTNTLWPALIGGAMSVDLASMGAARASPSRKSHRVGYLNNCRYVPVSTGQLIAANAWPVGLLGFRVTVADENLRNERHGHSPVRQQNIYLYIGLHDYDF